MTAQEQIKKYLKGRKTGGTVPEIHNGTGINTNTIRRAVRGLGVYKYRKCRIGGDSRLAYVGQRQQSPDRSELASGGSA